MLTKAAVVVLALAILAASAWIVRELPLSVPPVARPQPPVVVAKPISPATDVRAQIRRAVETEVPPLKSSSDLDRYLDELAARARKNGRVSALEVEPGRAAIAQLAGPEHAMEKTAEFTQKMAKLSEQLEAARR